MAATADAHILNGADGRLVRPYHLQVSDPPLLQFPTHHPCQRAGVGPGDVGDVEPPRVQLVARAHGADDRHIVGPRLLHEAQLRRHGVDGIHHIVVFLEGKPIHVLRQHEALAHPDICLGIDLQHPLGHDFCLVLSHGPARGDDLAVQVGQAHLVVVDQVKRADAASDQCLADITAHAADAEYRHAAIGQPLNGKPSQQELRSRKLIQHVLSSSYQLSLV